MTRSEIWLTRLNTILENSTMNYTLNNKTLANELAISERGLFRKIKQVTGMSPRKFLRRYYLHRAMMYLQMGKYKTVKEAGYEMGYSNVSYFIIQFEKEFGKKPFQVLKEHGWR